MVDSAETTLHKTPEAFNRVRMHVSHDIHASTVIDTPMREALVIQSVVGIIFIRENRGLWKNVLFGDSMQCFLCGIRGNESMDTAFAATLSNTDYATLT